MNRCTINMKDSFKTLEIDREKTIFKVNGIVIKRCTSVFLLEDGSISITTEDEQSAQNLLREIVKS